LFLSESRAAGDFGQISPHNYITQMNNAQHSVKITGAITGAIIRTVSLSQ
jgi:hypothetical protein